MFNNKETANKLWYIYWMDTKDIYRVTIWFCFLKSSQFTPLDVA